MSPPIPFDLQPHLTGERLALRPLAPDDFDALYAVARDPLIWEQHPESDRWREEVYRAYFDGGLASGGALVVTNRATGRVIGSSRFANLTLDGGEVEIGWTFLAREYWGGAWNGEMKALMIAHAFRFVPRVVFSVGATNLRSQRALAKIGARWIADIQRADRFGTLLPYVLFAIDRPGLGNPPARPGEAQVEEPSDRNAEVPARHSEVDPTRRP
jgi:RimJ/RimL family protein N-acetyltransferase